MITAAIITGITLINPNAVGPNTDRPGSDTVMRVRGTAAAFIPPCIRDAIRMEPVFSYM